MMDKVFHEKFLDRIILTPTRDVNHDGLVNSDDVVRDDLSMALMMMGSWTPIKLSVEIGAKAIDKKKKKKAEEERKKRETEVANRNHLIHTNRLLHRERTRQKLKVNGTLL